MWVEHVTCMAEDTNAYEALGRKSEGRPHYKWENSIKMGYI
jgi:hypothetical protein